MPQFSFEKISSASRDSVYKVFSDYENYQKISPQFFPSIRIRSVRDKVAVVEEHLILGDDELVIMAKHVTDEPVLHDVFQVMEESCGSLAIDDAVIEGQANIHGRPDRNVVIDHKWLLNNRIDAENGYLGLVDDGHR